MFGGFRNNEVTIETREENGEKTVINFRIETFGDVTVEVYYPPKDKVNLSCPPLLMVHGMFGGGWYFYDWAIFLCKKGMKIYVIRDMHQGDDLSKTDFYTYLKKAINLAERIYIQETKNIIVLGHSMGGLITQKIAERFGSDFIAGIVLVASAPPKGISAMSCSVVKAMLKHLPSLVFNLPLKIDKKSTFKLILNWLGDDERKEQIFEKFVPESSRVAKQLAFSKIPVDHKKIVCKSLVVAGLYDKLLPHRIQIKIANKYDADFLSFLKGHMMMLENKREDEIINGIYRWMSLNFICESNS